MKNPYKKIRTNKKETKDEHRLVMEEHLGRKLNRYEVVHHINGNKMDNRLENLELMSLSEHSRKEMIGNKNSLVKKNKDGLFFCSVCKVYKIKEEFSKRKSSYFGISSYCKKCRKIMWKEKSY